MHTPTQGCGEHIGKPRFHEVGSRNFRMLELGKLFLDLGVLIHPPKTISILGVLLPMKRYLDQLRK